ncbi:hypothetical protein WPS_17920 [Vulcanimicrobium alpinum]|uniref:Uncharacterized protein n=1 Tax=Vulcanimicrobium alpinum TaxID=3016050 RepID=A0AAN1XXP2_UNVUL|nr:DUF6084 family protein [Vulcanimicrobium alpinum]BDE06516.1 hypothetical protein WPS_17920 [Vulcanimicrobium alpinum]
MSALAFAVEGARGEPYAAAPTIVLDVRVTESTGTPIAAIALRTQVRLEPQRRRYDGGESVRLEELFGEPRRYGETLRSMLWMHVASTVTAFREATTFTLPLTASYDFDVAANKYLSGLAGGVIPLALHFSGMVFVEHAGGVSTEMVPWACEAAYALPVSVWRDAVDACFPNAAWLRVQRELFDDLREFRSAQRLTSWDATLARLLALAKVER